MNQIGTVIAATLQPASGNSGGMVAVHTVKFTHQIFKSSFNRQTIREMPKSITHAVNYSFIEVLP